MTARPRFAVLRDGEEWPQARVRGLRSEDGALALLALPATDVVAGGPGPVAPSGIAVDDDGALYLTDTAGHRLVRDDLVCGTRRTAGSRTAHAAASVAEFHGPAGECVGPCGWLYVADAGAGRVTVHTRPDLARRAVWRAGLRTPIAVAGDGDRALLVADPGRGQVVRLDARGAPDDAVGRRFARAAGDAPIGVAVGPDGLVLVADADLLGVARFTRDGDPAGDPLVPRRRPSALAVAGGLLHVADELTGHVVLVDLATGAELGVVGGVHGAVAALAAGPDGRVWIKPGPGPEYVVAEPGRSRAPSGHLVSGPHDAGEDATWFRVEVTAETPEGTAVSLETATGAERPGPWRRQPAHDVLLDDLDRHLWIRVALSRRPDAPDGATPRLHQVAAATTDRGFAAHLPDVYRDEPRGDLERMVALAESALGGVEDAVDLLARTVDPQVAPAASLAWLAAWQDFALPAAATTAQRRAVAARIPELTERRGTAAGLRDLVEVHTGVRVVIVERHTTRGVWTLGERSLLGGDTMLPARDVGGFAVGDDRLGEAGPEDPAGTGAELFDPWAHRITVLVPCWTTAAARREIAELVEREKPAHVLAHVCVVEPRLRVGLQARLGIDAVIGRRPTGGRVGSARLDVDAVPAARTGPAPIGSGHLGQDVRLG